MAGFGFHARTRARRGGRACGAPLVPGKHPDFEPEFSGPRVEWARSAVQQSTSTPTGPVPSQAHPTTSAQAWAALC